MKAGNAGPVCNISKSQAPRRGRQIRPIMEDYRQLCAIVYMCFDPSGHDVYVLGSFSECMVSIGSCTGLVEDVVNSGRNMLEN